MSASLHKKQATRTKLSIARKGHLQDAVETAASDKPMVMVLNTGIFNALGISYGPLQPDGSQWSAPITDPNILQDIMRMVSVSQRIRTRCVVPARDRRTRRTRR